MDVFTDLDGEYHIKLHIHNKAGNFAWTFVVIYGASHEEFTANFLCGMVNLAKDTIPPSSLGDFNLLTFPSEKNRGRFHNTISLFYSTLSLTAWI
jgi:hypothetical protein